jgi:hypothetical protein
VGGENNNTEELTDLYSEPSIVKVTKSRRMRWAGNVARMGGQEMYTRFWWEHLRERDRFEDPSVDGRMILRWILRKWDMVAWTGSIWLRLGTGECGNEPSGCIKCGEFLHS